MKNLFPLFLFFSGYLFGQSEPVKELRPLKIVDTLFESKIIDSLKAVSVYNDYTHFLITKYKDDEGLFFIKSKEDYWIVYESEFQFLGPSAMVTYVRKTRDGFVDFQVYEKTSGECVNTYGHLFFINIEKCETVMFSNYYRQDCYDKKGELSFVKDCRAEIEVHNGIVFIESKKIPDDGMHCESSGEYVLEGNQYVRVK